MCQFSVDLRGRTALLTGAGTACGAAIALALAASGAKVSLCDINIERAEAVADKIIAGGGEALAQHSDVSNRFQAATMIERARDRFGSIDILVNAAGAYQAAPLLQLDEWDWRRQLELNATGTFFCMQLVARVMADEGGGVIINLTAGGGSLPAGVGYVAGKSAVSALTRQAARELGPRGIRVNAIAAGNISGDAMPAAAERSPLTRRGRAEDIAGTALFLCSAAADYITGQVILVDGGASLLGAPPA